MRPDETRTGTGPHWPPMPAKAYRLGPVELLARRPELRDFPTAAQIVASVVEGA